MRHGSFGWHELTTPDPAAALAFYRQVIGWNARPAAEGSDYTVLQVGDYGVGGVASAAMSERAPGWIGYVAVDDVDKAAERALALGGSVVSAPADIPGVLRRATVADPDGAVMVVFRGLVEVTPDMPRPPAPGTPGRFAWAELIAHDWSSVFDFYAGMFGWTRSFAFTLGPVGAYQVFAHEGRDIGGMMNGAPELPASYWGYYVQVDEAARAAERWTRGGGTVAMAPHEAPGGRLAAQVRDPQGLLFGLLSTQT